MFSRELLRIDSPRVGEEATSTIREQVLGALPRRGAVVGVSGGIDSSVVAALARARGPDRVLAPDRDRPTIGLLTVADPRRRSSTSPCPNPGLRSARCRAPCSSR